MVSKFRIYIGNVKEALSQLGNALIGGDPDETMSSRAGKRERDNRHTLWSRLVVWITSKSHVQKSIEDDQGTQAAAKDYSSR